MLREAGWETGDPVVVSDGVEPVAGALRAAVAGGAHVVITSGGTGVAPRDLTPEATRTVIERELPGIAETLRRLGAEHKLTAVLTRGLAGVVGSTVVVNLPGSTGGVRDGLDYLLPLLPHVVEQLAGGDH
jgi:molybdenum cofactor synthesis domain-containing protein